MEKMRDRKWSNVRIGELHNEKPNNGHGKELMQCGNRVRVFASTLFSGKKNLPDNVC